MPFALLIALAFGAEDIPLDSVAKLQLHYVNAETATYKGKKAMRVVDAPGGDKLPDGLQLAIVKGTSFQDGVIDVDLSGDVQPGAEPIYKGFTGIAFRVNDDGKSYEAFYVRPRNGRIDDQVMRNHSTQYLSVPDWPWQKLREQFPGMYESYVDLVPGDWVHVRIEVHGEKAKFFVRNMEQPVLIVNGLKHGISKGALGLWVGPKTLAHFANLTVTPQ
jgi:hypothetical protein